MSNAPVVVMVDDNPGDIFLVRTAFQEEGIDVEFRVASSGPAAYYLFRQLAEDASQPVPDLLVLDLNMPGFNGIQLLAYIRMQAALQRLKVVILSSTSRPRDQARAMELGAGAYLVKPLDWPSYSGLVHHLKSFLEHGASAAPPGDQPAGDDQKKTD